MLRVIRFDTFDDQRFAGEISLGHEVDIAFFHDVDLTPEFFEQDLSRVPRGLDRKIEHR